MHGVVRDRLEDLLLKGRDRNGPEEHLAACSQCSSELNAMKAQSRQFETLCAPENLELSAGFYAKVLQRIEEHEICSVWSFFIDSPVSRRLAFVSLSIAVVLGSYVVTESNRDRSVSAPAQSIMALNSNPHYDAPVMGSQAEQRDAVLENFAAHHLIEPEGQIR